LVDDNSTDKTIDIAKKYKVKVVENGSHNIERGKSIGLQNSKHEFIFFIDADNVLTSNDWFRESIEAFRDNKDLIGVQSCRFKYKSNDNHANRYCELIGINDPYVLYLGKRGLLMATEAEWIYPETLVKEDERFYFVKFNKNKLPTTGSQGYMTRKSLLKKTDWSPYLFHLDSVHDLVSQNGFGHFAFIKYDIEHDYASSLGNMLKKLKRNIDLFWKYSDIRRYKYDMSKIKLMYATLLMITFIIPSYHSILEYSKKKDLAWFLHPIVCFLVPIIYLYSTVDYYLLRLFRRKNDRVK
jgi:glycosyltransferase involved in cell wall biosynthesis